MSLQHRNDVVKLAHNLLDRMKESLDPHYGLGTMTCSIYDTAWVSMISKTNENGTIWLFPQSFTYLLDKQQHDGGWHPSDTRVACPVDGILNTAAALLSLCRHREIPHQLDFDAADTESRISRGLLSLSNMLNKWKIEDTWNVGFEILVPALLDYLGEYGMEFDFPCRSALYRIRDTKLCMLNLRHLEEDGAAPHSILHSLEALRGHLDFDGVAQHKVCGSIMASPSATAAYLIYATVWDLDSEAYLRHVLAYGIGCGSGGVPSAFPATIFESTWVLSTLLSGGMGMEDFRAARTSVILDLLKKEFQSQQGLVGFASKIQPDADDTAKGITCLNTLSGPASSARLVEYFGQGEWFKTYSQERNNVSPFYTMMLLAQALRQAMVAHMNGLLVVDQKLYEEVVPLVLIQILIHILHEQRPDGSWEGFKETTAYALLALHTFNTTSEAELLGSRIEAAVIKGRSFLANSDNTTQPEPLWIEKVQYGSRNISEAYIIAAMYCSSEYTTTQKPAALSPIWQKEIAMGRFYEKLPLLKDASKWLVLACAAEGSRLTSSLRRRYQQILQNPAADGNHIRFIPFTWTMVTRLIGAKLAPNVQLDMMIFSALLYALDHHMETSIAAKSVKERQTIRETIVDFFDHVKTFGLLPLNISMDKLLEQIVTYVWQHPKAQGASAPNRQQLLEDLRQLFLSHLDQLDDNEDLRRMRRAKQFWHPNTHSRHSCLQGWIQSTSGHHTGGGAAFSFFLCFVLSGHEPGSQSTPFPSPQARYILAKLSESLRALSRLQNDWGSIERDYLEGNLNSADFLVASPCNETEAMSSKSETQSALPRKSKKTEGKPSTEPERAREILGALAEHEKRTVDQILLHELPGVIDRGLLAGLRVFVAAVEIYGQMYMMLDHTPRNLGNGGAALNDKDGQGLNVNGNGNDNGNAYIPQELELYRPTNEERTLHPFRLWYFDHPNLLSDPTYLLTNDYGASSAHLVEASNTTYWTLQTQSRVQSLDKRQSIQYVNSYTDGGCIPDSFDKQTLNPPNGVCQRLSWIYALSAFIVGEGDHQVSFYAGPGHTCDQGYVGAVRGWSGCWTTASTWAMVLYFWPCYTC
ncbi:hypothetical protein BJY04DRAFT_222930 [Aspergillus karnatakaensis]|uniref:terpene synthase family protein n=1 Tax=Aspergillus karnatakaensis TaxID=1810916 RepID=UPI003CCCB4A1